MAKPRANIAASVKDRLFTCSRLERTSFDVLLVQFALERLLYRLSISAYRDRCDVRAEQNGYPDGKAAGPFP